MLQKNNLRMYMNINLTQEEHLLKVKDLVLAALDRDKAEDVKVIDLSGKVDFARFAIIATGRANRHVVAMAEKISDDIKASGLLPGGVRIEGLESKQWVLVDAGAIIVHLFLQEVRETYNLQALYTKLGIANAEALRS